jgi:hypothetical protein
VSGTFTFTVQIVDNKTTDKPRTQNTATRTFTLATSTEANLDVRHQPAWHSIVQLGGWGGDTWWEPFPMETLRILVWRACSG